MAYDDILRELNSFAAKLNSIAVGHVAANGQVRLLLTLTVHQEDGCEVVLVEATDLGRARFGAALGAPTDEPGVTRLLPEQTTTGHVAMLLGLPAGTNVIRELTGQRDALVGALIDAAHMADGTLVGSFALAGNEDALNDAVHDRVTVSARTVLPEQEHHGIDMSLCARFCPERRDGIDIGTGFRHVAGRLQRVDIHTVPVDVSPSVQSIAAERLLAHYALVTAMRNVGVQVPKMHLHYDHLTGMPVVAQERFGEKAIAVRREPDAAVSIAKGDLLAGDMRLSVDAEALRSQVFVMPAIGKKALTNLLELAVSEKVRMLPFVAAAIAADRAAASVTGASIILTMNEHGALALRGLNHLVPAAGEGANAPIARQDPDLYSHRVLENLVKCVPGKAQVKSTVSRQAELISNKMVEIMADDLLTRGYLHPETAARYRREHEQSAATTLVPAGIKQSFKQHSMKGNVVDLMARRRGEAAPEP